MGYPVHFLIEHLRELDFDCIKKMREWILTNIIASEEELIAIENEAKETIKLAKNKAWANYLEPIKK